MHRVALTFRQHTLHVTFAEGDEDALFTISFARRRAGSSLHGCAQQSHRHKQEDSGRAARLEQDASMQWVLQAVPHANQLFMGAQSQPLVLLACLGSFVPVARDSQTLMGHTDQACACRLPLMSGSMRGQ